jgi:hypothetical protein
MRLLEFRYCTRPNHRLGTGCASCIANGAIEADNAKRIVSAARRACGYDLYRGELSLDSGLMHVAHLQHDKTGLEPKNHRDAAH